MPKSAAVQLLNVLQAGQKPEGQADFKESLGRLIDNLTQCHYQVETSQKKHGGNTGGLAEFRSGAVRAGETAALAGTELMSWKRLRMKLYDDMERLRLVMNKIRLHGDEYGNADGKAPLEEEVAEGNGQQGNEKGEEGENESKEEAATLDQIVKVTELHRSEANRLYHEFLAHANDLRQDVDNILLPDFSKGSSHHGEVRL